MTVYGIHGWLVLAGLLLVGSSLVSSGCGRSASDRDSSGGDAGSSSTAVQIAVSRDAESKPAGNVHQIAMINRMRPAVEKFCGDCHAMPRPSSSPREEWPAEVEQGFMLYRASGRTDLEVPDQAEVLAFFQAQAGEQLQFASASHVDPPSQLPLQPAAVRMPGSRPPGVTNVRWIDLGLKGSPALVYCDIGTGAIKAHWPQHPSSPTERLATLLQPVHVEAGDLDSDGLVDLVVADIGEFNANDSDLGRVVWLRRQSADTETFESIVLQDGLSRVADVRPGDFDSDGDIDVLVGVFGWRNSGSITLLENTGLGDDGRPQFTSRLIDDRHGSVHVPPVDLNGDGHLDFVALISQDHEVVEAFINDGSGNFDNTVIWAAPDPAYGSSGIELVDMDADGDLDVLYSNGDSFDRGPKPFHSIQWLENTGSYPYTHHPLTEMPGVLNARAGDFDGDGDVDVVAASLLAGELPEPLQSPRASSVMLLLQTAPGQFERRQLEAAAHQHISIETGDFDANGQTDIAVGNFLRQGSADQPDLTIWWNRKK